MAEVKGTRVRLPAGVHPPFEVFINGVIQEPGRDYQVRGDVLLFDRDLVPPPPETPRSLLRGLFWGRYRAEHVVDVAYQANGRGHVASGLEILADERD
ncbi:MAG TPA: hypothetical protein VFW18_03200 [Gaiellales bacterium]|nr:hypothetical protein [Gaiellales bacterium]